MTKDEEKPAAKSASDMETVTPKETFLGFPFGGKGIWFHKGVESVPIRKTYAQLLRDKGLVPDNSTKADAGEKSKA